MTDTYQAIYDGVRSRISNGDVGFAVERVAREAFDIGWQKQHLQEAIYMVANEMVRPSVVYRPTLAIDGTAWCALLGENLQEGVAGFGTTPAEAMAAFDAAFLNECTPAASGTEARRAETENTGSVHDGPTGEAGDAQP